MVVHRRKKSVRYRGSKTHGCGSMKKRRGKGNRGGKGNAGSGKRADGKKPSFWNDVDYFGKHGFKFHGAKRIINAINIRTLYESFINKGLVKADDIDLDKIGYNKLLGSGKVLGKLKIKSEYASASAVEKIKAAGGEITLTMEAQNEPLDSDTDKSA